MTDDEINRRVAEIEGWERLGAGTWVKGMAELRQWAEGCPLYATDWAWCGPLAEKYIELLEWDRAKPSGKWLAMAKGGVLVRGNDTPQRAICLAVIAAHDGRPSRTWAGLGDK